MSINWKDKVYLMGINNITLDSFSGDGLRKDYPAAVLVQAKKQISEGADILDFGAESTRPGAAEISATEEIKYLEPIFKEIRSWSDKTLLSVDTYKAETAEMAAKYGVQIINDVWGTKKDPLISKVAAKYNCYLIITHNNSEQSRVEQDLKLGNSQSGNEYADIIADIKSHLSVLIENALIAGVKKDKIIIDPGFGFGKNVAQNLELLKRLSELKTLGFPILSGTSRKSFIGHSLNLPPDQRLAGSAAANAISIMAGADIIRVHDVEFMRRVADFSYAVRKNVSG